MLIFNCTRAFAKFIEPRTPKCSQPLVMQPPGPNFKDDARLLRLEYGTDSDHMLQWQCHVIEEQGRSCVIAMEVDTRFAMVFTTLKPGDPELFISTLIERLFNLQWSIARELQIVSGTEHDAWLKNFIDVHRRFCFVARTDRSVQAHINEVARDFVWELDTRKCGLPGSHHECATFDATFNDGLRSTRDRREYFCPDEAMLFHWLQAYSGWTPCGLTRLRATIGQRSRRTDFRVPDMTADLSA
jgi:hypothetical protein